MHEFQIATFIRELWQSTSSTIWLAQTSENRLVAVKVPHADHEVSISRLILEIWFLHELADTDHIVPLLHVDADVLGTPRLVMPYMPQDSLSHRLYFGPRLVRQNAQIIGLIADTLQRIHDRGFLHLDVKPGNILLDSAGTPFLTDFGHAVIYDPVRFQQITDVQAKEYLTLRSTALPGGTWEYMAPEQFDTPAMELSPASDIYALGVSLFEVLARRKPYKSYAADPQERRMELRDLHRRGNPPDILEFASDLEVYLGIKEVLANCLQTEPEARYQCAAELGRDIKAIFGTEYISGSSIK